MGFLSLLLVLLFACTVCADWSRETGKEEDGSARRTRPRKWFRGALRQDFCPDSGSIVCTEEDAARACEADSDCSSALVNDRKVCCSNACGKRVCVAPVMKDRRELQTTVRFPFRTIGMLGFLEGKGRHAQSYTTPELTDCCDERAASSCSWRDEVNHGCTATLLSPSLLLTARHCFSRTDYARGGLDFKPTKFIFFPGVVRKQTRLFFPASPSFQIFDRTHVYYGEQEGYDRDDWDYAVVVLPEPFRIKGPFLQLRVESRFDSDGPFPIVTVAGYPGPAVDRFEQTRFRKPVFTQWTHSGPVTSIAAFRLYYEVDTTDGDSGGPVFSGRSLLGVHTASFGNGCTFSSSQDSSTECNANSGLRVTCGMVRRIFTVCDAYGKNANGDNVVPRPAVEGFQESCLQ